MRRRDSKGVWEEKQGMAAEFGKSKNLGRLLHILSGARKLLPTPPWGVCNALWAMMWCGKESHRQLWEPAKQAQTVSSLRFCSPLLDRTDTYKVTENRICLCRGEGELVRRYTSQVLIFDIQYILNVLVMIWVGPCKALPGYYIELKCIW